MAKFIGNSGNQIPTNNALGGGAYQDQDYFYVNNMGSKNFTHNMPQQKPLIDFNFALSKTLPPEATFTRSSLNDTYVDKHGVVNYTYGIDVPRFTHDPVTKECLGLIIERVGTNYFLNSNDPETGWNEQTGTAGGLNAYTSPDGTVNAGWVETNENQHWVEVTYNPAVQGTSATDTATGVVINRRYTHSAWVKYISGDPYINFYIWNYRGNNDGSTVVYGIHIEYVDEQTLIIHPYDEQDADDLKMTTGSEYYGNGWHRVWFSTYISSTQKDRGYSEWNWNKESSILPTGTSVNSGTTTRWAVWGQQLERDRATPTTLMPTTGSAKTRNPDFCRVDDIKNLSAKEGLTMFCEGRFDDGPYHWFDRESGIDRGNNLYNCSVSLQTDSSNHWSMTRYRSGLINTNSGWYYQFFTGGTFRGGIYEYLRHDPMKRIKLAATISSSYSALYINGYKAGQSTTGHSNTGDFQPTIFKVGDDVYGSPPTTGYITRATLWKAQLTDAELTALTENEENNDPLYQSTAVE